MRRVYLVIIIGGIAVSLLGCGGGTSVDDRAGTSSGDTTARNGAGASNSSVANAGSPNRSARGAGDQSVALLGNRAVRVSDMRAALLEAGGPRVLEDLILDRMVERRLAQAGLSVNDTDVQRERNIFADIWSTDADEAARLVREIRRLRGLGDVRFQQLLKRNAALRKLIKTDVQVSGAAIDEEYQLAYGPKYRCRLIVVPRLGQATQIVQQARGGANFIDLAVNHSTDVSARQGGLLPLMSPVDATFEKAVREQVRGMRVGQVSDPINIENGFAIVKVEQVVPGQDVPLDSVRDEMRRRRVLRIEAQLMGQERNAMLRQAAQSLVILDPVLKRAWDRRNAQ